MKPSPFRVVPLCLLLSLALAVLWDAPGTPVGLTSEDECGFSAPATGEPFGQFPQGSTVYVE